MSSGNAAPYDYADAYRNFQQTQQQVNEASSQRPQALTVQGGYPPYPPTHQYQQMYYQHQNQPHMGHHQHQLQQQQHQQQQQQQLDPAMSMYNRSVHQPRYPAFNHFIPPNMAPPQPPMPHSTFNNYGSHSNNNNNNNYQNPVANDWTPYQQQQQQQQSWGVANQGNPRHLPPYRPPAPPSNFQTVSNSAPTPYISSMKAPAAAERVPEPVPPVPSPPDLKVRPEEPTAEDVVEEEKEEKETKKPVPIMVGKRRGGRVLPTGAIKKPRPGSATQGRTDAWGQYMAEVKKYKEQSCEEERKNRPLVK